MNAGEVWRHKTDEDEVIKLVEYLENDRWLVKLLKSIIFTDDNLKHLIGDKGVPIHGSVIYDAFIKIADSEEEYNASNEIDDNG